MKLKMIALALCVGAASCATITRGTHEDFVVESTPSGASVQTSNGFQCASTPCTFRMERKSGFTVTVTKDGYQPATFTVLSSMSGGGGAGFAGNVLAGGLIGMGVDATSGAMNDLKPNPLHVDLQPIATAAAAAPADATAAPVAADASAAATATAPATPH
ncbi:MAG: PEGA domain-containing protein [Terricaulis sp.]